MAPELIRTVTNRVPNPSTEVVLSDWINNGSGTTVERASAIGGLSGSWTIKVVPGQENWGYINPMQMGLVAPGETVTFSIWVYTQTAQSLMLLNYHSPATAGPVVSVPANNWTRLTLTQTIPANATAVWLSVRRPAGVMATTFYMDAFQIESGSTASPYFDGSTADRYMLEPDGSDYTLRQYSWTGAAHASSSIEEVYKVGERVRQNLASPFVDRAGAGIGIRALGAGRSLSDKTYSWNDKLWFHVPSTASNPIVRSYVARDLLAGTDGQQYTVAADVGNPTASPITVSLDWADMGATSYVIQPGQWRRIRVVTSRVSYDSTYRFSDIECPAEFLITDWVIEKGNVPATYFDGNTARGVDPETGHAVTYAWTGAPGASTSIEVSHAQIPRVTFPRSMRSGWRYFATRLNGDGTETLLDPDLPLEGVTVENVLSGHGSLEGALEPVYSRLLGPDGQPLLQEYSTAIYAEADGDVRGGGILVNSGFDGPTWDIEAVGFTGYALDMPYVGNGYKGIRVDPIDVVRTIWQHIQNQPGGDIALEFDQTTTNGEVSIGTELRQVEFDTQEGPVSFESGPYKLNWYTNHDLAGDIDDLAAETPFDYAERHYWDADGILRHHVDLGYPRLGNRRENLRFVYGVNIFDPTQIERDGTIYASGTLVLGAGEGASMIKSLREPPTRPGNRLRRVAVVVDDSIRSRKKAVKRADQENQWRRRIDDIESIIVRDHPNAPLGAVKLGDEIRLEGKGEWVGVDMWVRVLAIAFQPENGNVAEYTVARTDKLTS